MSGGKWGLLSKCAGIEKSKETLKFLDTDKGLLRQSVFPSGSRMPPLLLIVIVNGRVKRLFFGGGERKISFYP